MTDEPDLDYGETDEEYELLLDAPLVRSDGPLYPGRPLAPFADWHEFFLATARTKVRDIPDPEVSVSKRAFTPEVDELPQGIRSKVKRLSEAGFEVHVRKSTSSTGPTLYKSSTDDHDAGDVYRVGYRAENYGMSAVKVPFAIAVYWQKREGKSCTFKGADTFDPIAGRDFYLAAKELDAYLDICAPKKGKK